MSTSSNFTFRFLLAVGLTFAMAVSAFGQIGSGQNANDVGNARAELERTDQLIESARDAVRVSNSVRAQLALENAEIVQSTAWEQFSMGNQLNLGEAVRLTRMAREQVKKALVSAGYNAEKPDVVQRRLERAEELLMRVKDEVGFLQDQQMVGVLESAEDNLRVAWEFYRDAEYRPALKLANQVDNAVRRLISVSNRQMQGAADFERFSTSVREMLEAAAQQIAECDSETAPKLIEEARSSFDLARDLAGDDEPRMAIEALQTAKSLATQARLDCSGFDGTLSERYNRIKAEADQISETIPVDDEGARQLMNQVYEQLDLAGGYIYDGDTKAAAASLKAAQLTLNQVSKLLNATTE